MEALAQQLGPGPAALHAGGEVAVVILATAHVLDARHHPARPVGAVLHEPLAKNGRELPGQAQHLVEGAPRASLTLYGRLTDEDVVAIQSDETIYGGRINLRLGRLTTVSLRIEQRSRDSDDPLAEFDETAGGLYLRYGSPSGAEGWR